MEQLITVVLPLLFVLAIIVGVFYLAIQMDKKVMAKLKIHYQGFAEKFSLSYVPEHKGPFWNYVYPQVTGAFETTNMKLYSYKTGGKNKTTYSKLIVSNNYDIKDFRIIRKGFFQKIGKAFGAQDIITGYDQVDDLYVFKCKDEAYLKALITSEVAEILLYLKDDFSGDITCAGSRLTYEIIGHIDNEKKAEIFEKIFVLMQMLVRNAGKA